jgi:type II secretory pathway component PulF
MVAKPLSARSRSDLTWLCRRLAEPLQDGATLDAALQKIEGKAPDRLRPLIAALRRRLATGGMISKELTQQGAPSYVAETVEWGERRGALDPALFALADHLEWEQAVAAGDPRLRAYALGFGRLGMLLGVGMPALQALEPVAESLRPSEASEAFAAARKAIADGASVADALQGAARDLPPTTFEMIRDGEDEGRLGEVLPIVADYVLDEAGQKRGRSGTAPDTPGAKRTPPRKAALIQRASRKAARTGKEE